MFFEVEKKYIIVGGILTVTLIIGGVLFWQNNKTEFAAAQISRVFNAGGEWMEIKPRTGVSSSTTVAVLADVKEGEIKTKKEKPVITWCAPGKIFSGGKTVIINEVAWMGNVASYTDEWIELKNVSGQDIDLAGWQLQNKNQKIKIAFESGTVMAADGFYLLERTNDDTVPGVAADRIYSGNLGNSNEALYLFDADCAVRDSVQAGKTWPGGDNKTKQTMARTKNFLWQNSKASGGTPGTEND